LLLLLLSLPSPLLLLLLLLLQFPWTPQPPQVRAIYVVAAAAATAVAASTRGHVNLLCNVYQALHTLQQPDTISGLLLLLEHLLLQLLQQLQCL
jgi:hypothetical protein